MNMVEIGNIMIDIDEIYFIDCVDFAGKYFVKLKWNDDIMLSDRKDANIYAPRNLLIKKIKERDNG